MYFVIFGLLRVVLRGRTGGTTMSDLLVLVLIADAAAERHGRRLHALASGTLLVATMHRHGASPLTGSHYRVPSVGRIVHPEKAQLVQNGRLIRPTLRREMITEEELMSEIRLQGLEKLERRPRRVPGRLTARSASSPQGSNREERHRGRAVHPRRRPPPLVAIAVASVRGAARARHYGP